MSLEPLSVAVVGVGNVGKSHVEAYADHPLVTLTALVDVDEASARSVAAEYGVERTATDLASVLAEESIDAVSIATPEAHHLEPTRTALEGGCHVLLEKPIAESTEDAREIVQLAEHADGTLTIGYNRRFAPQIAALHEDVAAGALGDVLGIYASHVGRKSAYDHGAEWTHPMYYVGVHEIDAMRWLVDDEVAWVLATASDGLDGKETPAIVYTLLGFAGGTVGVLETNWGRHDAYPNISTTTVQLTGTDGYANVSTERNNASVTTDEGVTYLEPTKYHGRLHGQKHDTYYWEIDHFVRCVRTGEPPLVTPEDGLRSLEVANAIIESAERGEIVRLDDR